MKRNYGKGYRPGKRRFFGTSRKKVGGYDSGLEKRLHDKELNGCQYHSLKLDYIIPHTYEVDFIHPEDPNTLIEVKGRFETSAEASKYVHIQKCNPDYKIVFLFENHKLPIPGRTKRKDGTIQSHGEWATKNGFEWWSVDNIPERYSK